MNPPADQALPLVAEQRRYLRGPIVLHNPGWADSVPEWLITAIPVARLEQVTAEVAGETERDLATLEEVCAYLYTASLAFPLDRDYTAIYLWTTAQALSRQGHAPSVEAVFEMLGEIDAHDQTLTAYQDHDAQRPTEVLVEPRIWAVLRMLRQDIRRSVTRHARAPKP